VREAFAAGASGYVLKQSPFREVVHAVEAIARGETYLDSQLASTFPPGGAPPTTGQLLTNREADVLRRGAVGQSNKDIGVALGIAVKTVEVHKSNAMRKLSLRDRGELIQYALKRGWLQDRS
jgi:DNA-binding NarL/FixJ family response regulator